MLIECFVLALLMTANGLVHHVLPTAFFPASNNTKHSYIQVTSLAVWCSEWQDKVELSFCQEIL